MDRRRCTRLALLMLTLIALAACSMQTADEALEVEEDAAPGEPADDADFSAEEPADADEDAPERAGDGGEASLPSTARQAGRSPERIIKEGTITLEVDEGEFTAAYERVVDAARRQGGSVTATTSTTDDAGRTTGSVTVRVPVENYEHLLVAVTRVATPVAQDIRSEEVTGQVVDLQSRLRHLRAQEAFYLGLLDDADSVQDAIAVQQHVDDIQQRIEQLQGRLDYLEDRADFSTLTVEIVEAGADPVLALARDREPSLATYWEHARNGFVTIIGWALVVTVTLAPLAVPLAMAYLAWRWALRRRPHAPAPAAADAE